MKTTSPVSNRLLYLDWLRVLAIIGVFLFHNARFYAPPFAFLSPAEQGRFEALCRDLAALPVAEASEAVEAGRVVDEATGEAVEWAPGEMIAPVTRPVRRYLESSAYRDAAAAAREAHSFRVVGTPTR